MTVPEIRLPSEPSSRRKALDVIRDRNAFVVLEGSVRSSKTVLGLWLWTRYVLESPETSFLMVGRTVKTIERNAVLNEYGILAMIPGSEYRKVGESRAVVLRGRGGVKKVFIYGGSDSRAALAIRGASFGGLFADEANCLDEDMLSEALRRLSSSTDKRVILTLNPEAPSNFLYTDYIDRYAAMSEDEKRDLGGYSWYHFTPKDNPAMTPEMIASLEALYPRDSYLYSRYVLGLRVQAEGLVYPMITSRYFVDMSKEVLAVGESGERVIDIRYAAMDVGFEHPTVVYWMGFYRGNRKDFRVVREYFDKASDKTASDHYAAYLDGCSALGVDPHRVQLAIDPAALVMRKEFLRHGIPVVKAKNEVVPGISFVRMAVQGGYVTFDTSLRHFRDELSSYSWADSKDGKERPIKENDDAVDAMRYLLYTFARPVLGL